MIKILHEIFDEIGIPKGVINTISGSGREVSGMSAEELKGKQLYIDPAECIDCGACLPECPVKAIYATEEETVEVEGDDESVKKNYEFFNQSWKGL